MKTRSIPAQITTVEDRIAGNLNLTQIILLMLPIFNLMVIYALLPQPMHLSLYKIPIVVLFACTCLILALRIKGKVVLNWIVILLKYNTRPMYYLYDKNELYLRDMYLPRFLKKQQKVFNKTKALGQKENVTLPIAGLAKFEALLHDPAVSFSIREGKRGGLHVALEQK